MSALVRTRSPLRNAHAEGLAARRVPSNGDEAQRVSKVAKQRTDAGIAGSRIQSVAATKRMLRLVLPVL